MSKKIAVLVNEDTMQRCSCGGCLKAFMNKADSFERYADEDIELVGFTHSGGDLAKKIESFKKKGVTTVHLSTCTRVRMKIMKASQSSVLRQALM